MFISKIVKSLFLSLILLVFAGVNSASLELDDGYMPAGETEYLHLFLNEETGRFIVVNRNGTTLWRSIPALSDEGEGIPELLVDELKSHFVLYYTDIGMEFNHEVNEISDHMKSTYELIENGFVAQYYYSETFSRTGAASEKASSKTVTEGSLEWSIVYRLRDDYLEVSIPEELMVEDGDLHFVSLKLLPYFGADDSVTRGGMLLPIGNGAYLENRERSAGYLMRFTDNIYGPDKYDFGGQRQLFAALMPEDMSLYFNSLKLSAETVGSPVFGMLRDNEGFLAIVDKGAADAKINAGQYGSVVDLNRVSVEFIYRRTYTGYLSRTRQIFAFGKEVIPGDRAMQFHFLSGPSLSFIDFSEKYREYLRLQVESKSDLKKPVMNIRILCGVAQKGFLTKELVVATTFEQVREIIDSLVSEGMSDVIVTLVGWGKGGYYGSAPNNRAADARFGGNRGLEGLISYAHDYGIKIFLEIDYLIAISGNGGFSSRNDVLKKEMDIPYTDQRGTYLLTPKAAYENFALKEIPRFKDMGVDGVVINNLGEVLIGNHDRTRRMWRQENMDYLLKIVRLVKDNDMAVMATGWNSYTFPLVDGLQQMPSFGNRYFIAPSEVPFVSGLLHGYVPYFVQPLNLSENLKRETLRMLEFGFLPSFELTYQDPIILRSTTYNMLFSSRYDEWLSKIKEVYNLMIEETGYLYGAEISEHEEIAPEVYQSTYKDGTIVIVNYGTAGFSFNDRVVGPESYLLVKP